jgi:protein-tyrosine phosphatase
MIDIHSHILPGLDDGAKNMEETLLIISQLHKAGFHTIIATPHVMEGKEYISPSDILEAVAEVQKQVSEAGIPVKILPGAENHIFPDMGKWASEGKLLTIGNMGKYILIELPMTDIPHYTEQVIFELQIYGFTPVLAHPERYLALLGKPELILEWARKGVIFQLNLRSINGRYGPQCQKIAELMLKNNLVHFIGSDAHTVTASNSAYEAACKRLKEFVNEDTYQGLIGANAYDLLNGQYEPPARDYVLEGFPVKKKSFWTRFKLFQKKQMI